MTENMLNLNIMVLATETIIFYSYNLVNSIAIKGGIAVIEMNVINHGNMPYNNVKWNISAKVGYFHKSIYSEGIIAFLPDGGYENVKSGRITGFGPLEITGKATVADLGTVKITWQGFILGSLIFL
jgi:uncharacterized membrane protein